VQEARAYAHQNLPSAEVQAMGIDNWENTTVGFSDEQIVLIGQLMQYMPKHFYEPLNGLKFGIILRAGDFKYAGESYTGSRMIGVGKDDIDLENREGTFSLFVHEDTHALDASSNEFIWSNIKDILGDKDFSNLPYMQDYFTLKQAPGGAASDAYASLTDAQLTALGTFSSFIPGQSFAEGIAGFSQLYVLGPVAFLNAVGPFTDGSGYGSSYKYTSDLLSLEFQKYPKAFAIYNLYKNMFFEGKEYYDVQLQHDIQYGSAADQQEMEDEIVSRLTAEYNINIVDKHSLLSENSLGGDILDKSLQSFPTDFYDNPGRKLNIVITSIRDLMPALPGTIYLSSAGGIEEYNNDYKTSEWYKILEQKLPAYKDSLNGNKTRDAIVQLLGGEQFINNPEGLYPSIFSANRVTLDGVHNLSVLPTGGNYIDVSSLISDLSQFYVLGEAEFVRYVGAVIEPGMSIENENYQDSKTRQLYLELESLFDGKQYNQPHGVNGY